MSFGAFIESGLQNWQIIQQTEGAADISLAGRWRSSPERLPDRSARVYGRVVLESTGGTVVGWTPADYMDDSTWRLCLRAVPRGGLYRVETCLLENEQPVERMRWARRGDMRFHIGVGDVFVIAGQSNAAGYGREPAEDAPELGVHLLRNSGFWDLAAHPFNESTDTVHEENMENTNPGSGPFLTFAKKLKHGLGAPIGLIQTAKGGSSMSRWTPGEEGDLFDLLARTAAAQPGGVRGVVWYHGCSDAIERRKEGYERRFGNMVNALRERLRSPNLPFFTVQLNRHLDEKEICDDASWGGIREAQRRAADNLPAVYVLPSEDLPLSDGIHNSSAGNITLGDRLARQCLSVLRGEKPLYCAPDAVRAVWDGACIRLDAVHLQGEWRPESRPDDPRPFFTAEDERGPLRLTRVAVEGGRLLLYPARAPEGRCRLHGGAEANPTYNLPVDSATGLPLLAFYGLPVAADCNYL